MKLKRRILFMLVLVLGLALVVVSCRGRARRPLSRLTLSTSLLDFGQTITEQQFCVTKGDMIDTVDTVWEISSEIPFWADVDPTSGTLTPYSDTNYVRVRVNRLGVGPGRTTAELVFSTSSATGLVPEDTVVLSVEKSCDLLGDDFNEGNASGWNAGGLVRTQKDGGYVRLKPNSPVVPGRLVRPMTNLTVPCVITARFRHALQEATNNRYGILLEDSRPENALYFAVNVDENTNYSFHQFKNSNWKTHRTGKTNLISTRAGDWNILRLELYEADQRMYARGFAGTASLPLFDDVELGSDLEFTKAGIRSDEYTIDGDWYCGVQR
jgi:hypothetical protein